VKNPRTGRRLRCRLHGGKSTGPKTEKGRVACARANWRHGKRSRGYIEKRRRDRAELRRILLEMELEHRDLKRRVREHTRQQRNQEPEPWRIELWEGPEV